MDTSSEFRWVTLSVAINCVLSGHCDSTMCSSLGKLLQSRVIGRWRHACTVWSQSECVLEPPHRVEEVGGKSVFCRVLPAETALPLVRGLVSQALPSLIADMTALAGKFSIDIGDTWEE